MNLGHPFTFSQMHNKLEWKGIKKVSSSKTTWRQKKCLQRERSDKETQRKPPPPFFTGQWPALQLILFHICGVVIINVMLVVLSSTAKKYQHQYAAPFFKWVFFLPAVENYHTVRYCSNFSFYAMPNNLLLLWTELHCYWFNENISGF